MGYVGTNANRDLLQNQRFSCMYCPSSTLPPLVLTVAANGNANIQSATYAGISGAADPTLSAQQNLSEYKARDATGAPGWISWGGVLVRYSFVPINQISDGTSNTLMVGEQSDFLLPSPAGYDGRLDGDCRSDCWHGFAMGPSPGINGPNPTADDRSWNITCVIYPINERSAMGYGIYANCGASTPIQSVHPHARMRCWQTVRSSFLRNRSTCKCSAIWRPATTVRSFRAIDSPFSPQRHKDTKTPT